MRPMRSSGSPPTVACDDRACERNGEIAMRLSVWVLAATATLSTAVTVLLATSVAAHSTPSTAPARPSSWSRAVSDICAHALLFEGSYEIGTREGAVAVANDIRASTSRRLQRIRALNAVPPQPQLSNRWLRLERRLAALYASSYVR